MAPFVTNILRAAPDAAASIALLVSLLMLAVLLLVATTAVIAVRSLRWSEPERRDAHRMVKTLGAILIALTRGRPPDRD